MKELLDANLYTLNQLEEILHDIKDTDYQCKLPVLNDSSIGMHFRHVLEFYDLLLNCSEELCYDDRPRRFSIENNSKKALNFLKELKAMLQALNEDRHLTLSAQYDIRSDMKTVVSNSISRELAYNLEHCRHHMALIRIGLQFINADWKLPETFGMAPSSLRALKLSSPGQ